ncbi:MAG TPA: YihY/virulence factor BrkB family protein [Gaiellales bacterium]
MASTRAARIEAGSARTPQPSPQPERHEPTLADPGLTDLTARDYGAICLRGVKKARDDQVTHLAQAVAFNAFLAIPSTLLLALGIFSAAAGPGAVNTLLDHLSTFVPSDAIHLVRGSLRNVVASQQGGLMIAAGAALAVYSLSGAMQTVMWSLNMAYECDETRGFVRTRVVSVIMGLCGVVAVAAVVLALVLGPAVSGWIGDRVGESSLFALLWSVGRWPVLVLALMSTFAAVLYLGPNVRQRKFQFITPGVVVALVTWLLVSGAFALYANNFGSYNKTWGSLAAVIVTLTWLWFSSLALLLGAEINAETERSRGLRRGIRANSGLVPEAKA